VPDALLTYYDADTGERTAVPAGELGERAAAVAALLRQGCRARTAAVRMAPHWQTAAVLLGAWAAGVTVSVEGWATAGLGGPRPATDAAFVSAPRARSWLEEPPAAAHRFVVGLRPGDDVPGGYRDFEAAIGPYAGAAPPPVKVGADDMASVDGTTYGAWREIAAGIAEAHGIGRGDRVLIRADSSEQPAGWLLAPLVAGATIVLCAGFDDAQLDEIAAAELVTIRR
jgi:uncharacterized protein (TIGR03089 family)